MRRALLICFLVFGLHSVLAVGADNDWHNLPPASAVREIPHGVEVRAGSSLIRITALSDSVARVRVAPKGTFAEDQSWAVLPDAFPSPPTVKVRTSSAVFELDLGKGTVRIELPRRRKHLRLSERRLPAAIVHLCGRPHYFASENREAARNLCALVGGTCSVDLRRDDESKAGHGRWPTFSKL